MDVFDYENELSKQTKEKEDEANLTARATQKIWRGGRHARMIDRASGSNHNLPMM